MEELFADVPTPIVQAYQRDMIDYLRRFAHTKNLREILATRKFSEIECDAIKRFADRHYSLKKDEAKNL